MDTLSAGRDRLEQLIAQRQHCIWAVYHEDGYETAFGDGFYVYVGGVYASKEQAESWARRQKSLSQYHHFYIYSVPIGRDDAGELHAGALKLESVVGRHHPMCATMTMSVDEVARSLFLTEAQPDRDLK
jgi:hypothetical protein